MCTGLMGCVRQHRELVEERLHKLSFMRRLACPVVFTRRRPTLYQRPFAAKQGAQAPTLGVPAPGNPLYKSDWCAR